MLLERDVAFAAVEREYMELAKRHGRIVLYVYPDRIEGIVSDCMKWTASESLVGIVDELKSPEEPRTIKELLALPKDEE